MDGEANCWCRLFLPSLLSERSDFNLRLIRAKKGFQLFQAFLGVAAQCALPDHGDTPAKLAKLMKNAGIAFSVATNLCFPELGTSG